MKKVKTIMITGGHLSPALALIEVITERHLEWRVIFVGRKRAQEGSDSQSEEFRLVSGLKVTFVSLTAGRLTRTFSGHSLLSLLKIPLGFAGAFAALIRYRPQAVVTFGGYLGLPVAVAAWLFRIPVILHEQTSVPGLTSRFVSRFARSVCVSYPEDRANFSRPVIVTGLPLRKSLFDKIKSGPVKPVSERPLIFIGGGTTGSLSVNRLVWESLTTLLPDYEIVHQTGRRWHDEAGCKIRQLPAGLSTRYHPVPFLDGADHAWMLQHAACYVGRSGANTVAEIGIYGLPAVFIPLPWSAGGEQEKNARRLKRPDVVVVNQSDCTKDLLKESIASALRNAPGKVRDLPAHGSAAAVNLASVIESVVNR